MDKDPKLMTTDERLDELAKLVVQLAEAVMHGASYTQTTLAQKVRDRAVALADRTAF